MEVRRKLNIPSKEIESVTSEPAIGNLLIRGFNNEINAEDEVDLMRLVLKQADAGNWQGAANDLVALFNRLENKYGRVTIQ